MNAKAVVLVIKNTGNVLAAVSRAAEADAPLTAQQLAGTEYVMRDLAVDQVLPSPPPANLESFAFTIPAEHLKGVTVTTDPALFTRPRHFAVVDPTKDSSDLQAMPGAHAIDSVSLASISITVSIVPKDDDKDTPVWAQITGPALTDPVIASFKIAKSQLSGSFVFGSALPPGTYSVLVFVPASKPYANSRVVP